MNDIFGIHAAALKIRAKRAEILAANIANADTPHYKARDIDFRQVLGNITRELPALKKTHAQHLDAGNSTLAGVALSFRQQQQPSLDGNTVDLQQERSEFMQNAMMYQASLRFINGRINGLITAIRGEI